MKINNAVLAVVVLVAGATPASQGPAVDRYPEVVNVALGPTGDAFITAVGAVSATARFRVTTDGAKVTSVQPLSEASTLTTLGRLHVQTWQFAPHRPTTFETTLTVAPRRKTTCDDLESNHWGTFNLPVDATFLVSSILTCDPTVTLPDDSITVSRVSGEIRCECEGRGPLPAAAVELHRLKGNEIDWDAEAYRAEASATGRFDFSGVTPGPYLLSVAAEGFFRRDYRLRVERDDKHPKSVDARLRPNPAYVPTAPVFVARAPVPGYPAGARQRGVAGQVKLRVETSGQRRVTSGPAELAQAALDNLRHWQFAGNPRAAFEVVYDYSLTEGDCGPQQNPAVRMELPFRVAVVAKRAVACADPQMFRDTLPPPSARRR